MDINSIQEAVQAIKNDTGCSKEAAAMIQIAYELHRVADALEARNNG